MDEWTLDKQAHVFYGMNPVMYDQGMRLDFERASAVSVLGGSIRFKIPIVHKDGTSLTVNHNRPNTVGILSCITDKDPNLSRHPEQLESYDNEQH